MARWPIGVELEIMMIKTHIRYSAKVVGYELDESIVEIIGSELSGQRFSEKDYVVKRIFFQQKLPINC